MNFLENVVYYHIYLYDKNHLLGTEKFYIIHIFYVVRTAGKEN